MQIRRSAATGRPPIALVLVAALHVGFIYIFNEALGLHALINPPPKRLVATVIEDRKPIVPDVIIPLVRHDAIPDTVTPEVPLPPPFAEEALTINPVADPVPYTPPDLSSAGTPEPDPPVVPVSPRSPLTQPEYPPGAIRSGEEGVVDLAVLVLRDGRVADVRVVKSSGHQRLDRAAIEEARRKWRLQPARKGDVPIDEWGRFRVIFQIDR